MPTRAMRSVFRLVCIAFVSPMLLLLHFWHTISIPSLCFWKDVAGTLEIQRHGWDPAPEWLVSALQALPRREFNSTELELLRVEGMVPVRGLVADDRVLAELRRLFTTKYNFSQQWKHNGVMNALVRHSPLPSIASSSLGGKPVSIWNSQVEPRPARSERTAPYPETPWRDGAENGEEGRAGTIKSMSVHDDIGGYAGSLHSTGYPVVPLSSIFLALSDIPFGLHFIAGSHLLNEKYRCPHGPSMHGAYECFDRLWNASLGERVWDLKAGDAVVFWGGAYHWTTLTEHARQALSIRYIPADLLYTGRPADTFSADMMPPACGPLGGTAAHPIMHPPPALAPGLDPATGSGPGQPWPVWPRCPGTLDVEAMVRWIRVGVDLHSPTPPPCEIVGAVQDHNPII